MVYFYNDSTTIERATINLLKKAKKNIYLETYIYDAKGFGKQVLDLLIEKVKIGVKVGLLIDGWGTHVSIDYFKELIRLGGKVTFFRPVKWGLHLRKVFRLNHRRNHRKILIVDDSCIIGSKNIDINGWKESAILLEGNMSKIRNNYFLDVDAAKRNVKNLVNRRKFQKEIHLDNHLLVYDRPGHTSQKIKRHYLSLIKKAKRSIIIVNSYFLPDFRVRKALYKAVKRGVNVTILLPKFSDVKIFDIAAAHLYGKYYRKGLNLFFYKKKILHSKLMLVDSKKYTVGSANLDYRSFIHQYELNVFGRDEKIARDIKARFARSLVEADVFDYAAWKNRNIFNKLLSALLYKVREIL